jgi:hypothetical protein
MEESKEEIKPNPDLAKLVSMFYLRSATTLKHEYDHPGGAYQKVVFKDERFPQMDHRYKRTHLGSVRVKYDDNDTPIFVVQSRLIANQRYKHGSTDFYTKESKSIDKALKTMLDFVRPYSLNEVRSETVHDFTSTMDKWVYAAKKEYNNVKIESRKEIVEEMLHLKSLGVQFKTSAFRKLAEEVEGIYAEYKRRTEAKFNAYHVVFTPNMIYVTAGGLLKTSYDDFTFKPGDATPKAYQAIETLPENILSSIGLLKMVNMGESVDEVGIRVNENEFYILEKLDNPSY